MVTSAAVLERFASLKPTVDRLLRRMQMLKTQLHSARAPASGAAYRTVCAPVATLRPSSSLQQRAASSTGCTWFASPSSLNLRLRVEHNRARASLAATKATRHSVTVVASWGAEVTFTPVKLLSTRKIANDLYQVIINVGDIAQGYTKAGQYVQVKVGDSKPGFFAVASPPDANNAGFLELLIKSQPGSTAELLCSLPDDSEVLASPVMGKGFPVEKIPAADFSTVLLFATGSGISPVKALIESGALEAGSRKDVRLYYGTRNAASSAYLDRVPDWEAAGVKVNTVYSEDGNGYVQDAFSRDAPIADPKAAAIVLCGQKGMCEAVKALAAEAGVDAGNVLLNF